MKRKQNNTPKFSRRLNSDGSYTRAKAKTWGGKSSPKKDRLKSRLTNVDDRDN